ncbi:MAG TPA: YceH family protein [Mariprofundaceae bacterium]|nr:YceH family protein [Mariprofundaceae bacterium]
MIDYDDVTLSDKEARVLGSLMEKQMATPEYYPLTLNALVAACNQKSSREPVMNLAAGEVANTINALRGRGLVTASSGGRADRFEQQLSRKLGLSGKERAVICVLLLRGAQTVNEIRIRTDRMADFSDNADVLETLTALAERETPLVMNLGKASGQREERFTHLLCGEPDVAAMAAPAHGASSDKVRIAELEAEVAALQAEVRRLRDALGGSPDID